MTVSCPQCMEPHQLKDASIRGAAKLTGSPSCGHRFVVKGSSEVEAAFQDEVEDGVADACGQTTRW